MGTTETCIARISYSWCQIEEYFWVHVKEAVNISPVSPSSYSSYSFAYPNHMTKSYKDGVISNFWGIQNGCPYSSHHQQANSLPKEDDNLGTIDTNMQSSH